MHKRGKKEKSGVAIALEELKKQKRQDFLEFFFLSLALFSTSLLLILFSAHFLITGFAAAPIDAEAGSITTLDITETFGTTAWAGIYGLALRVPGFSEQLDEDLVSGTIARQDLFFDCIDSVADGGNEVYASLSDSPNFETLEPATSEAIDNFLGCGGSVYCADNTFTQNMSIMLGSTNISGIPSTHTYKWDGDNEVFTLGVLNDSENLVFVTHISTVQKGYSYNVTVNYQLMLPTPEGTTQTYYFFTDPNDECPAGGGVGNTIDMVLFGNATDSSGNPLSNVSVIVAGVINLTDSTGFYNLTANVVPGTYNVIAQKTGYDDYFTNVTVDFDNFTIQKDIVMNVETPGVTDTISPTISGYVYDSSNSLISGVTVSIAGASTITSTGGNYSLTPSISAEPHPIIAYKTGYNNYYAILNFSSNTTSVTHDITLTELISTQGYTYPTGPYTSPPGKKTVQQIIQQAQKNGEDNWISTKEIIKEVRQNTFIEERISIYNFKSTLNVIATLSESLQDFVKIDKSAISVPTNSFGDFVLTIYGTKPIGTYNGTITLSGGLDKEIPVTIKVVERRVPIETLLMKIDLFDKVIRPGDTLKYKLSMQNLLSDQDYRIFLENQITDLNNSIDYAKTTEEVEIQNSLTLLRQIEIPKNVTDGEYLLKIDAIHLNLFSSVTAPIIIAKPIYMHSFFGIPVWVFLAIISFFSFVFLNYFIYKRHQDKKKRYRIDVDYKTLPGPGDRTAKIGKVAESKKPAYLELERLTTHTIVAGATGMGKSISAQVLIEEALRKDVAVIVFDPTAQWSGMLRKCTDKKMLSFYPKFGLKPTDAQGFPGNVRQVVDARQIIDVNKYMEPGHIQIFSLNKLTPDQMDIFVANVIREIFRHDPKESPVLKTLIVFDEVHRLLPKFGGSGQGFLQIERGCREFRKWGLGLILISQVLNDFVGEIKANINTEVQTRTTEEGDLERIKTKFGGDFLKSLIKAEVGVVMFQNAEYNRGRPYFVQFRPILHNTRRLSDEELEKYNEYNDVVDQLEYEIEQLEGLKVDVFDLKMELKLVKDKIMVGNFSIVEIYLEGLKPRLEKQWQKLGKKPKKLEIKLADMEDIKKSVEEAKKEKEKIIAKEEKDKPAEGEKKEKENIEEKLLQPLTFDNGMMISSLKELKDVLPDLEDEVFKIHVNDEKNEIAKWLEQISEDEAKDLAKIKTKEEMVKALANFAKEDKKKEKSEDKKDAKDKGKDKEKDKEKKEEKEDKKEEKKEEKPPEGEGEKKEDKGEKKDKDKSEPEKVEEKEKPKDKKESKEDKKEEPKK